MKSLYATILCLSAQQNIASPVSKNLSLPTHQKWIHQLSYNKNILSTDDVTDTTQSALWVGVHISHIVNASSLFTAILIHLPEENHTTSHQSENIE